MSCFISSLFLGAAISKQLRASTAAACGASMGKSCHTQEEEKEADVEEEDAEEEEQVTRVKEEIQVALKLNCNQRKLRQVFDSIQINY